MRRDRQMFPPRQLLHAAATRGEAASDLPKKQGKKERKEGRKEGRKKKAREERRKNPSFRHSFIQLESLARERERERELFVESIPKKKGQADTRARGWTVPI